MSVIPEDIRAKAFKIADGWAHDEEERIDLQADIARALIAERKAQRDRVVKMLTGIADVIEGHVESPTAALLTALADAVQNSDAPDETAPKPPLPTQPEGRVAP